MRQELFHQANQFLPHLKAQSEAAIMKDRKSTRLNSSHDQISYAVFCLKKKKKRKYEHLAHSLSKTTIATYPRIQAELSQPICMNATRDNSPGANYHRPSRRRHQHNPSI